MAFNFTGQPEPETAGKVVFDEALGIAP